MPRGTPVTGDTATFLRAILANPRQLGAIAPSSARLGRVAAAHLPEPAQDALTVVELGPGGGVITDQLRDRLSDRGRLYAIEVNARMAAHLRASRPWLHVIEGDAAHLATLLADHGVDRVDAVVSALPWTLFDADTQHTILGQIAKVLSPQGMFATVVTCTAVPLAGARHLRRHLPAVFRQVRRSRVVLRNTPPAFWWMCQEPACHG